LRFTRLRLPRKGDLTPSSPALQTIGLYRERSECLARSIHLQWPSDSFSRPPVALRSSGQDLTRGHLPCASAIKRNYDTSAPVRATLHGRPLATTHTSIAQVVCGRRQHDLAVELRSDRWIRARAGPPSRQREGSYQECQRENGRNCQAEINVGHAAPPAFDGLPL
jgi:hypothetical protein